jgi:hypothetical protein
LFRYHVDRTVPDDDEGWEDVAKININYGFYNEGKKVSEDPIATQNPIQSEDSVVVQNLIDEFLAGDPEKNLDPQFLEFIDLLYSFESIYYV